MQIHAPLPENRRDMDVPVTRVIFTGLEIMADFDSFSRIHPRRLKHYLQAVKRV